MKRIRPILSILCFFILVSVIYYNHSTEKSGDKFPHDQFTRLDHNAQLEIVEQMAIDDPKSAWEYLKESFIIDGQVVGNVHGFAHSIGNKAYEKLGINGIKICDPSFAYGCFHGVTEEMLAKNGLGILKLIESECLKIFPRDKSLDYVSCIHGTGHGVYEFESRNLKKALDDCDIISEPYREYCYDGVFMENSFLPENWVVDDKSPWKFCTDLEPRYERNCARYQSQIFLAVQVQEGGKSSIESGGERCAQGPRVVLRETCYESLGYYVAQNNLGKVENIWNSCKEMPSIDAQDICIVGAAKETIFQKYSHFENSGKELCEKLKDPKKSECLVNIINMSN